MNMSQSVASLARTAAVAAVVTASLNGAGTVFRIIKDTPTVALRNSQIFEVKSSSGFGLNVNGSGSLVMSGTLTIQRATDLGWTVKAGADTACNTTCTHACVFGVDNAATEADIVSCTTATADECLCAGPT